MGDKAHTYQHIVPQCYLKGFATHDSKSNRDFLYVYDKKHRTEFQSSIANIGGEKDFYTISNLESSDKNNSKLFETDYLARYVEPEYAKVLSSTIQCVSSRERLPNEIRELLSFHIAIQFLRTKKVKDSNNATLNRILPDIIRLFQYGIAQELKNPSLAELKIEGKFDCAIEHFNDAYGSPDIIQSFASALESNYWTFFISTYDCFFTSDFPIIVEPHVQDVRPINMGLTQYGAELTFPISSNILLTIWDKNYFSNKSNEDLTISTIDEKEIRRQNYFRYKYCSQLYSKTNDFFMPRFWRGLEESTSIQEQRITK